MTAFATKDDERVEREIHRIRSYRWKGDLDRGDTKRGDMERGDMERGDMERGDMERGDMERGDTERGNMECGRNMEGRGHIEKERDTLTRTKDRNRGGETRKHITKEGNNDRMGERHKSRRISANERTNERKGDRMNPNCERKEKAERE